MKFPGRLRVVVAGTAVMAAGLGAGNNAAAADQMIGFGKETFQLNLGYYRPNFTTSASESAPGSVVPPGNISGENDLGLDKSLGVGRLDGFWRFADKHRLFFGYYNLDRSTTATLNKNIGPIQIPSLGVNDTILAGSNVKAEGNWQVYVLGYGYSFYKTDTVEIAGKFGLNVARIGLKLSGTLNTLNNGVLNGATAGSNSDVTAPLPVLALSGDWAINERWRLKGNLGGFKANVSDVKATVTDASVATEYRVFRNIGVGAGYSLLRVTGDIHKNDNNGSLNWRTGGWTLYASMVF
jgi:hypothetical protein